MQISTNWHHDSRPSASTMALAPTRYTSSPRMTTPTTRRTPFSARMLEIPSISVPSGPCEHGTMSRKSRVLLLGALVSFAGYFSLAVLATQQHFFAIDLGTRSWIKLLQYEALDLPIGVVTELGDALGLVPLLLLTIALLWRSNRVWAIALPVLMIGAWALQIVTKWWADRPRPNDAPWGFPSGHVLSLVVFFGLMIWLIATASTRRRRWRALACGA